MTGLDALLGPLVRGVLADPLIGATFWLYRPDSTAPQDTGTGEQSLDDLGPYEVRGTPLAPVEPDADEPDGGSGGQVVRCRTTIAAQDAGLPPDVRIEQGWVLKTAAGLRYLVGVPVPVYSGDEVCAWTLPLEGTV